MTEAQAQSELRRSPKHQSPKLQDHVRSSGDNVLVWTEKEVNSSIAELIVPFTIKNRDER